MKKNTLLVLFLFSFLGVFAQMAKDPVTWKYTVNSVKDDEVSVDFSVTITGKWHLYTQYFEAGGPQRMVFKFKNSNTFKCIGKVEEKPKPTEVLDEIFQIKVQYYDKTGGFSQKIKLLSNQTSVVTVDVSYQVCSEETCIPFTKEFEITLPPSKKKSENETVATPNKDSVKEIITEKVTKQEIKSDSVSKNPVSVASVENYDSGKEYENKSLLLFFLLSFLGGIGALLTPCTYPMIPLTVTFFMRNSENRRKAIFQAVVYGLSIVSIFLLIGLIISATIGEYFPNWLATHWLPNIFFFLIFLFFAASFFGMFELTLPSWLINKSDAKADKGGVFGVFFMAFTLVLVSFSCTAPIVGSIISFSVQKKEFLRPMVGMLGYSLAFAIPFTLFAIFPTALQKLPKSGGWLNSVKVVLGFLELALGLKFLSVPDQTYHWGILDREVYLAIWIVIFALLGFYLLGKLKFHHDSDLPYISIPRLALAIIVFSFVVYLVPGMFGAPLKALAGWVPPQTTQDFDINNTIRRNSMEIQDLINEKGIGRTETDTILCEKPKYADKLHLPHGLKGYFDLEQALNCAKLQKKPVFLDFTGHGCVNCRKMEEFVWSDPKVLRILREKYILVSLYVDDKEIELPKSEWFVSKVDGKEKRTLGEKNFDIQKSRFNANAQPFYVILDSSGKMLLPPRSYNLDISGFVKFLEDGVKK